MAIGAGVYLALLGPEGMRELGRTNIQKAAYAAQRINEVPGLKAPLFKNPHFNEFCVDFSGTGKTVAEVNDRLVARGILGGKDVSKEFPDLGQTALYCVTENRTQDEIERLVQALAEVTR